MTIDLNKILNENDANEVKQMQTQFEQNGWCFVTLPKELILAPDVINDLTKFFVDNAGHATYSNAEKIYGYSKVDHKEGFKLLTGSYFRDMVEKGLFPVYGTIVEPVNYLSQAFDAVTKRLIEILDQHCVFQEKPSLPTLIKKADLSLKEEHFGMLDIVSYFNTKTCSETSNDAKSIDEVNCVAHYDPGLFSVSILSTCQGLQLKDRVTDQWIDAPVESGIGIIWLGEAASQLTNNRLKPGIHRVIYPSQQERRLTIWYELCTIPQLERLSSGKQTELMPEGSVTFNGMPDVKPIKVLPGENRLEFLKRIESTFGLSMSKLGPPFYVPTKHKFSFSSNTNRSKSQSYVPSFFRSLLNK